MGTFDFLNPRFTCLYHKNSSNKTDFYLRRFFLGPKNRFIRGVPVLLKTKRFLTSLSNVLPYFLKQTFLPIFWIFTEAEGYGIKSRLSSYILSTLLGVCCLICRNRLNWSLGHLSKVLCTKHLISAPGVRKETNVSLDKNKLSAYCPNLYTVHAFYMDWLGLLYTLLYIGVRIRVNVGTLFFCHT